MTIVLFLSSWPEVKPKNAPTPMVCRCADLFQRDRLRSFIALMRLNSSCERLCLGRVDRFFVHAARVEIADLLHFGSPRSRFLDSVGCLARLSRRSRAARRCFFSINSLKLPQREYSGGIGVVLEPAAIGVAVKIVARLDRRIHVLRVERRRILLDLRLRAFVCFRKWKRRRRIFCAGVCEASCTVGGREASGWAGDFSGSVCARRQIAPNEQSVTTRSCLIIFLAKLRRANRKANAFRSDAAVGWV